MNIKGVSTFRKPVSVKERKEINTAQPVAGTQSNFSCIDSGAYSVQDKVTDSVEVNDNDTRLETEKNELHSTNKNISDHFVEENDEAESEHESKASSLKELLHDDIYEGKNGQQLKQENKVKKLKVKLSEDSDDLGNLKLTITRNEIAEEMNDMNQIIFRGPDFLPEEPDPEGERFDLRHRTIDQRKNAEGRMIDLCILSSIDCPVHCKKQFQIWLQLDDARFLCLLKLLRLWCHCLCVRNLLEICTKTMLMLRPCKFVTR